MGGSSLPGSDSELVGLALQGESGAFGELYNRYFPSIYDFMYRMTRNAEEAADLSQETFVKAMENLRGLRDTSRFKSWLFSIAHNAALNRLTQQKREVTPPASESEEEDGASDLLLQQVDPDRLANPEEAAEAGELASLVWEAAASLDHRTYAVLDLHVRQGLGSAEIAEVVGVSRANAYFMLNRMKKVLGDAIGTFLLARRGSRDCEELRAILAPVSIPPITRQLRRTIDRHVRNCDICERRRRTLLTPMEIFGALAAIPAPLGLQDAIRGELGRRWAESAAASSAGTDGAIPPSDAGGRGVGGGWSERMGWSGRFRWSRLPWGSKGLAVVAAGAAVMAVVLVVTVLFSLSSGSDDPPSESAGFVADFQGGATATAAPTGTATPTATSTPTAEPTGTATPVPAPAMPVAPTAPLPVATPTPPTPTVPLENTPVATAEPPTHTPMPPTPTVIRTPVPPAPTLTRTPVPPTSTLTRAPPPPVATPTLVALPPRLWRTSTPIPPPR